MNLNIAIKIAGGALAAVVSSIAGYAVGTKYGKKINTKVSRNYHGTKETVASGVKRVTGSVSRTAGKVKNWTRKKEEAAHRAKEEATKKQSNKALEAQRAKKRESDRRRRQMKQMEKEAKAAEAVDLATQPA